MQLIKVSELPELPKGVLPPGNYRVYLTPDYYIKEDSIKHRQVKQMVQGALVTAQVSLMINQPISDRALKEAIKSKSFYRVEDAEGNIIWPPEGEREC